jgi:hypothetical protein
MNPMIMNSLYSFFTKPCEVNDTKKVHTNYLAKISKFTSKIYLQVSLVAFYFNNVKH